MEEAVGRTNQEKLNHQASLIGWGFFIEIRGNLATANQLAFLLKIKTQSNRRQDAECLHNYKPLITKFPSDETGMCQRYQTSAFATLEKPTGCWVFNTLLTA